MFILETCETGLTIRSKKIFSCTRRTAISKAIHRSEHMVLIGKIRLPWVYFGANARETGFFSLTWAWVAYSTKPVNAKPPARFPRIVGISFHNR